MLGRERAAFCTRACRSKARLLSQEEFLQMINEPVEGGLGEGAADLLTQMGNAGAFGGDDAAGEGEGAGA